MAYIPWWQRRLAPTLAERFELGNFTQIADIETLQGKWRLRPRPIQAGHIHANGQLVDVQFDLFNSHSESSSPTVPEQNPSTDDAQFS